MNALILGYFVAGLALSLIGCRLHAAAWGFTFRESMTGGWPLWVLGALFWPLAFDLLLSHGRKR